MQIRRAVKEDIMGIKCLADSFVVTPDSKNENCGFYNYSLTLGQYLIRADNPFFLVAESKIGLEGFCMAYTSEFIKKLKEREPQLNSDAVFRYLEKLDEPFIYIDQFAVENINSLYGGRVACTLRDELMKKAKEDKIKYTVAVVVHKPWRNTRAISFHTKSGSNLIQELQGKDNIVFGVYKEQLI